MPNQVKETRVLVLGAALLEQFEFVVPRGTSTALTFREPFEAFDLLLPEDVEPDTTIVESPQQRNARLWGRLELCLAFTYVTKWQ